MSYEEEFDRIVRQKAEEAEYPFDQANWEKAARMLDGQREARGGFAIRKLVLPVAIAAVVGTGAFFAYEYLTDAPQKIAQVQTSEESPAANTSDEHRAETASGSVGKAALSASDLKTKTSAPIAENRTAEYAEGKRTTVAANSASIEQAQERNTAKQVTTTFEPPVQSAAGDESPAEIVVADMLNPLSRFVEWSSDEDVNAPAISLPQSYNDYFNKKFSRRWFGVEGGLSYNPAWMQLNNGDGSPSWYAGVDAGRYLNRKLAVSTGLQAYAISGLSQQFHELKGVDYSFGATPSSMVMTTTQLAYAAIPVRVHYAVCRSASLFAEVNAGYLYKALNRVDTFAVQNDLPVKGSYSDNNVFEGMNRLNVQAGLGVDLAVTRRISVRASYLFGLSDVYRNVTGTQSSQSLRLGIHFTLCEK